jgi:predicted aspartyl protease
MKYDLDPALRRAGRTPHELAMFNLLVFNLMLCGGILASTMARHGSVIEHYRLWLILVPVVLSLSVVAYTFQRVMRGGHDVHWFVAAHWKIALFRYRILLLAYLAALVLICLGWLLSLTNPALQSVMFVALVRVAVAPLLIAVMVLAVLESSALFQAISGELPERWSAARPAGGELPDSVQP